MRVSKKVQLQPKLLPATVKRIFNAPAFRAASEVRFSGLDPVNAAIVRSALRRADQLDALNIAPRDAYLEGFLAGLIT